MINRVSQARPLAPVQSGGRFRLTPIDMTRADWMTAEHVEAAQRISLSIFTDMSNASFSLREALSAVYVSGMAHACAILTGKDP